jgi:hypothetical protein
MFMSYLPDQMLRNLAPQCLTEAQQRKADDQLGTLVAAVTRRTGQITQRIHAWARQAMAPMQATSPFES